jgi:hypothetical protein
MAPCGTRPFKEAPQRDRQFARNRNDHDPSDTPALPCSSLHKPAVINFVTSE